jgi:hypothetical protein
VDHKENRVTKPVDSVPLCRFRPDCYGMCDVRHLLVLSSLTTSAQAKRAATSGVTKSLERQASRKLDVLSRQLRNAPSTSSTHQDARHVTSSSLLHCTPGRESDGTGVRGHCNFAQHGPGLWISAGLFIFPLTCAGISA